MIWSSNPKFLYGAATLIGSTIGVGLYGIPFVFQKSGFAVGLSFLIGIVILSLVSNLLYGEVVLRTKSRHQFVGYVSKYLGRTARKITLFVYWVSMYGALIGIIIISGEFLSGVLSPFMRISPFAASTLFFLVACLFIYKGLKTVAKFDSIVILVFAAIVVLIAVLGINKLNFSNYIPITGDFWFLPFGVILFAMSASPGVPLVREVMTGREELFKKALILGTVAPAILYLFFAFVVVGISGESTSPDAISGLLPFLGPKVIFIGSLLGFLTSSTIFLNLAVAFKESFQHDLHLKRRLSWLATVLPPYLLFVSGVRNFIDIIGLVGGLGVSLLSMFVVFLYIAAKKNGEQIPAYSIRLPKIALLLLAVIFLAGAAYTIFVK